MKISNAFKSRIKSEEGLGPKWKTQKRIVAYLCPAGRPTIGYGHTKGVHHSDIGVREINLTQAESILDGDLNDSESYVTHLGLKVSQSQFDALVSLAMNCGSFGEGLRERLAAGNWKAAAETMKRYIHGSGPKAVPCKGACGVKGCKQLMFPGLVTRRAREAAELLKGTKDAGKA